MKLSDIAREAHAYAKKYGAFPCVLPRGLELKLTYREHDIVLKMSRDGVMPSENEVTICQKAFFGEKGLTNRVETDDAIFIAVKREDT